MDALANCPEYEQHVYRQARKGIHLEVQPILTEDDNYYFKVLKEQLLEEAYAKLEKWPLKRKLYIEMIEIYDATRRSNNIKTSEPAKVIDFAKTKCNFCHIELKWCVNCKQIHKAIEGKTLQGLKVPERACVRCQEHTTRAQTCSWSPSRNQIHLPLPDVCSPLIEVRGGKTDSCEGSSTNKQVTLSSSERRGQDALQAEGAPQKDKKRQ